MDSKNFHVQYLDVTTQHWHANSASFAGGDNLLTALQHGWEIVDCVQRTVSYAGSRTMCIYDFHLQRDGQTMQMPVIDNPYVTRLIAMGGVTVRSNNIVEEARSARSA